MDNNFEQTTLANISIVRSITNTLGGGLKKSLGQNFLINQNSLLRFIKSIHLCSDDVVIEIGPGIGIVTYTLCQTAKKVYAIEIDESKKPSLDKTLENFTNYEILWNDASTIDFGEIYKRVINENPDIKPENIKIIGSLPYNIAKRIISNILTSKLVWHEASFFVQFEVAESYVSAPPVADFLSNFVRIYADVDLAFTVPAEHFMPKPKVKTGVIHLLRKERFTDIDRVKFASFIKDGFAQPRKTLLNNLKSHGITQENLSLCNVKEKARPSELNLDDWRRVFELKIAFKASVS